MAEFDFRGVVELDTTTVYDCEEAGCYDNDFACRCGRIEEVQVTKISPSSMVYNIERQAKKRIPKKNKELFLYCLNRLCRRFKPGDFEVSTCPGYYGDEIDRIYLRDESILQKFFSLQTPWERVEFILAQEYGYVLEGLKGLRWQIEKVDLDRIIIPKTDAYRRLDRPIIEAYLEELRQRPKDFLSCLTDAGLKLVDGYHRYYASVEGGKKKIWVVRPNRKPGRKPKEG